MPGPVSQSYDGPDDEPMWCCGCGEFVDGDWHCPRCGGCPPWGCGGDHHDDSDDDGEGDGIAWFFLPWDFGHPEDPDPPPPVEGPYGDPA